MKNIITVLILIVFCNLIAIFASNTNFLASDIYRCMLISFIIPYLLYLEKTFAVTFLTLVSIPGPLFWNKR